jgi:RHS repeat-associated protein
MRDSTGRYTYAFDAVNRKTMVAIPSAQRLTYTFDAVSQRKYLTAPTGGRFTYTFDAAQRITRVLNPEGARTSYTYDTASRRTVKYLANGTRASFSYDNANELTRIANIGSGRTTISSYTYRYDPAGNRTAVIEADASRVTWLYDKTYQLTGENRTGTTPYRNTFTFDSRGNRLVNNQGGTRTTTTYDPGNQIVYSQAAGGRTTYVFDANGNQQIVKNPDGTRVTTTWNFENQPTRYNQPANTTYPVVTMAYNADNQRVEKDSPVARTKFIWDNQNYVAETDGTNAIQTVYTNEPQQYGNLISSRISGTASYHHFDAIGSTRQLTNASGTVTDTMIYDALGNLVSRTGMTGIVLLWIAVLEYYSDVETGLIYVRARSYVAAIGGWTTVDPTEFNYTLNPYTYVWNRVLTLVDPSGLRWREIDKNKYECECNDDTLEALALKVSGHKEDWVCIWPEGKMSLWEDYPTAKPGAQANVTNLTVTKGAQVKMGAKIKTDDNGYLKYMMILVKVPDANPDHRWTTGKTAAEILASASVFGQRPIQYLYIVGHHDGEGHLGTQNGLNSFSLADLDAYWLEKYGLMSDANRYELAKGMQGPPRCWLTVNAQVYGIGCKTEGKWLDDWAAFVRSDKATVFATTENVVAGTDGKKGAIAYFVSHPKDEAKTLKELLALDLKQA